MAYFDELSDEAKERERGDEDMTHTAKHTPQWELSSKHRDEQYIDEPLAEELRPLFRIHWDNNVSDTEAEQGAALIAAAPAMYEALGNLLKMVEDGDYTTIELNEARAALAQAEGKQ